MGCRNGARVFSGWNMERFMNDPDEAERGALRVLVEVIIWIAIRGIM